MDWQSLHATETGISSGLMGHLARTQIFFKASNVYYNTEKLLVTVTN